MARYIAWFMKDVLGANGHETEICQRSIEIEGTSRGRAAELAKIEFCCGFQARKRTQFRRARLWVANWQIWHESPLWCSLVQMGRQDSFQLMRDLLLLAIHLLGRVGRWSCTTSLSKN